MFQVKTPDMEEGRDLWMTFKNSQTHTILDVQACSNARVLLYPERNPDIDPSYEIVIGARDNTKTQIFRSVFNLKILVSAV